MTSRRYMENTPSKWALNGSTLSSRRCSHPGLAANSTLTVFTRIFRTMPREIQGVRNDFFGLVGEHHENQANFVPAGAPTGSPMYIIPPGKNSGNLSSSFLNLLAKDGIGLAVTNKYGQGLGKSQKTNFAPRVGVAYQVSPKLVARGGFGIFYNGFENRGFS